MILKNAEFLDLFILIIAAHAQLKKSFITSGPVLRRETKMK